MIITLKTTKNTNNFSNSQLFNRVHCNRINNSLLNVFVLTNFFMLTVHYYPVIFTFLSVLFVRFYVIIITHPHLQQQQQQR